MRTKTSFLGSLFAAASIALGLGHPNASAQRKIVVEGTVAGYEVVTRPVFGIPSAKMLLVEAKKTLQGSESSVYLLVGVWKSVITHDNVNELYGNGRIVTFELERLEPCDRKLGTLFETSANRSFTLINGYSKASLAARKKLSCYIEARPPDTGRVKR